MVGMEKIAVFEQKNVIKFVSTGVINGRHGKVLNVCVV